MNSKQTQKIKCLNEDTSQKPKTNKKHIQNHTTGHSLPISLFKKMQMNLSKQYQQYLSEARVQVEVHQKWQRQDV